MKAETLVACTRMYNVCEQTAALWADFLALVSDESGIPLRVERHPFPLDIEDLWARSDLGLAFICGRAFALGGMRHQAIAVPVREAPSPPGAYATHLLVREDASITAPADLARARIGWTVSHSHSGFLAVKRYLQGLAGFSAPSAAAMLGPETGPLHTPLNCLRALAEGLVEAAPLDAYAYDLILRNCPEKLSGLRILATTSEYPMPFLAASPDVGAGSCERLREAVLSVSSRAETAGLLRGLCLTGFMPVQAEQYAVLTEPGELPG